MHAEVPGFESRISWKNQSVPLGTGIYALPVEVMRRMEPTADQLDNAERPVRLPYIASYVRFPLDMLEEENDEIADLARREIHQFAWQMGARWIVDGGRGGLGGVSAAARMGRLLEIYQTVYDRHLSD